MEREEIKEIVYCMTIAAVTLYTMRWLSMTFL